MPGIQELIIILVIVILIFGGKRLKNIGSDLGGAIKGFKKSMDDSGTEKNQSNEDVVESEVVEEDKGDEK
ncbi:MAG: twin-arginine translocase TatA/TatE family subunit [Gammaproteobacteria bacterium]|jgi:sec-independent protein translocase protein TatA|nr:twin-arginine translocase TatA/TatE family subunit [Gammaproteobacteria bacterium]MDP6974474.1 twin-arginine translocase TatA/TatE family subunit [Gammaproteobacteria bacterium]